MMDETQQSLIHARIYVRSQRSIKKCDDNFTSIVIKIQAYEGEKEIYMVIQYNNKIVIHFELIV